MSALPPTADPAPTTWRALFAPIALLVLLAAMTAFLAINQLVTLRQSRDWVNHSHQVIDATWTLLTTVEELASSQRAYLLSQDPVVLKDFQAGRARLPAEEQTLLGLVRDNPAQVARAKRVIAGAEERTRVSSERVALYLGGARDAAAQMKIPSGTLSMDQMRAAVDDMMRAERDLLAERTAQANREQSISFIIGLALSGLAILGLGGLIAQMTASNRRLSHEINERIAAEASQRESQALYRAIFANNPDYLYVIDVSPEGVFSVAELNPAFERATGITTAATRGRDISILAPGPGGEALVAYYRRVIASRKPVFSHDRMPLRGGERVWESILAPVRNDEGQVERIVGSSRDVTEREQAEEQLRRSQRMEAVGHLTGGVAHDFNNLLQVIRGNLELVAAQVEENDVASQRIKNALHGANRAAQLTRQLLAFARRTPLEPKVVNLGRLVTDMAELLRRSLGESVEVETVIAGGLWNTLADPAQVESAVLNLAINSRDAMPEGGRLTIEITNAVLDETYARRDPDLEPGQYVLLAVSDTGVGMTPQTAAQVFEPFFTTKAEEKGTGLGLSMVYGFVKQSKGHVQIYSEVGQGTTVKIYLPRERQAETPVEAAASASVAGRSEVILVVEDDDLVRASAVSMLRELDYTCIHASDGAQALEVLKSGAKVDLLFTDVIMPGPVKARDLAAEAQTLRPGIPVLFTSGYTENAIVHHGRLDEGVQLLSKPYSREDLARRIKTMLRKAQPVVLVVEDDPLVRMAAVDMIETLGFVALPAADASAALPILKGDSRLDVLFTDVGLPGMRGPELAEAARDLRPKIKIIFASGYGDSEELAAFEDAVRLAKPYQQDQLAEVLAATPAAASAPA